MLKTEQRTTWDKIKVGEIFAIQSCWCILMKIDSNSALQLATNTWVLEGDTGDIVEYICFDQDPMYKLPVAVQRLWKEE